MNWIKGRPDDWHNPWAVDPDAYESGASAMLAALLVYLDEPCTEHPYSVFGSGNLSRMYSHRKDCPQCMAELKESEK